MNPKGQRAKLNDGHFIPVLGFGTAEAKEVTEVVWSWDINSSGCNMSERDLGCQALSFWLAPLATNQARTMSCEKGESIQSSLCIRIWGCAHLQITLGSPPVSTSFPDLLWGGLQWWGFSVYLISSKICSFWKDTTQRNIWVKVLKDEVTEN